MTRTVVVALLMTLSLAACGEKNTGPSTPVVEAPATPAPAAAAPAAPAASAPAAAAPAKQ